MQEALSAYFDKFREFLLTDIRESFGDVVLGRGISWSEANVIDNYGNAEERRIARERDNHTSWQALASIGWNPDDGYWAWSFLDSEGARFYLAAALEHIVSHNEPGTSEWIPLKGTNDAWGALDARQRRCAERFMFWEDIRYEYRLLYWREDFVYAQVGDIPISHRRLVTWNEMNSALGDYLKEFRDFLLQDVRSSFEGITLGGGVSWAEAAVYGRNGSQEELRTALDAERPTSWQTVASSNWNPVPNYAVWPFLDLEGGKFYLAAALMYALQRDDFAIFDWLISRDGASPAAYTAWASINTVQFRCLDRFLYYVDLRHEPRLRYWSEDFTYWPKGEAPFDWKDHEVIALSPPHQNE